MKRETKAGLWNALWDLRDAVLYLVATGCFLSAVSGFVQGQSAWLAVIVALLICTWVTLGNLVRVFKRSQDG